jgi:uncharacterized protein
MEAVLLDKPRRDVRSRDIYAVPVGEAYLVVSPLRQAAALINRSAYGLLCRWMEAGAEPAQQPAALGNLFTILNDTPIPPKLPSGAIRPAFLGILPTRDCNLSCAYCDFGGDPAGAKIMDLGMAAAAVDWMAATVKDQGRKTLDVHFFGGEPFMADAVIDVTVHRVRAQAERLGLIPRLEVATNGVFEAKMARFIGDYFDTVVLSFDGPKEIHDRHRPMDRNRGSFAAVEKTASRLSRAPVKLCLRVCVAHDNVGYLDWITRWFCESFQPALINFETLRTNPASEAAGLNPPDPYVFTVQYLKAQRIATGFGIETVYAAAAVKRPRHTFCPVGRDVVIVSADGRLSGCYLPQQRWTEKGLDLDLGFMSAGNQMVIDPLAVNRLRQIAAVKPRCTRCFCRWTCAGGCHVALAEAKEKGPYSDFCIQTRLITAHGILKNLALTDVADRLQKEPAAMQRLALHPSDLPGKAYDGAIR